MRAALVATVLSTMLTGVAVAQDAPADDDPGPPPSQTTASADQNPSPQQAQPTPPPAPQPSPPPDPVPKPAPSPSTDPAPADAPPPAPEREPAPAPVDEAVLDRLDPDEPDAPAADADSTAQAVAPGLDPPSLSDLGLVSPVTQDVADAGPDVHRHGRPDAEAAVRAAVEALEAAREQLEAAKDRLADAERALEAAQTAHEDAARELAVSQTAAMQVDRDLDAAVVEIEEHKEVMGALARAAYRTGGSLTSLAVVFQSTTVEEFSAGLRGLEVAMRSEDVAAAGMVADLADLAEEKARRTADVAAKEEAEQVALRALELAEKAAQTAATVASETEALVERQEEALAEARQLEAARSAQYLRALSASQAVSSSLSGWSETLTNPEAAQGTGVFVRPGYGAITSRFGPRVHPIYGGTRMHNGTDFGLGDGTVYSADEGLVAVVGYHPSYGNMTVISHGVIDGALVATLYAHQAAVLVQPGDVVTKAAPIGLVGSTGDSTGPHLHFEVRVNGVPVNAETWLVGAPTPEEYLSSLPDDLPPVPLPAPAG